MLSATRIDGGGGGRGQPPGSLPLTPAQQQQLPGGRFDFDDGGMYCGGWEEGKATGHGKKTHLYRTAEQGEYAGSWHLGFELSGCYTWPSGNTYSGGWQNGKRHGLGVETRGRWIYRGEWNQGLKGRYGTRCSLTSGARYEGTFSNGLQDGYGTETYADGGLFQGQWQRGLRHGYGVRSSAPFAAASVQRKKSLHSQPSVGVEPEATIAEEEQEDPAAERDHKIDQNRGGFVLKAHSEEPTVEKKRKTMAERKDAVKSTILRGLRLKKQYSTGDIDQKSGNHMASGSSMRSARSNSSFGSSGAESGGMASAASETNISFISQEEILEPNVTENYTGEWKNDKRSGYGVAERSDGLKYEGEWHNNRKYGYGVTSFRDGTREEGKYKNNILVSSQKKKATFLVRASRIREKIDQAVQAAQRASQIALQKADISMNRTATARGKAEQAEIASMNAKEDAEIAKAYASQFAPDNRGERPAAQYTNTAFNNHITDSAAQQRAQSLYGNPQHQTQNHNANQMSNRLPNPNIHVQAAYMEDDPSGPTGIAARIGGRLTVDDSHVQDLNNGSRRTSFNNQQPPQQGQQHLGDAGFEDYAPEQFLNRSSPRNLSVRNSVRSRRSVNYANNPNNSSNQHGNNANQYGNGANQVWETVR
ncbi:Junctophilin-3 [Hypsibius exemplaris]|uniref:Junctophilin-3 n=1 Tax=Hypsibius exemplaris TaxID=2072580 RepID=A0A1W0X7N9_HYPEX|nr:Junctophilin-3 [Hypsibius exemplaris]